MILSVLIPVGAGMLLALLLPLMSGQGSSMRVIRFSFHTLSILCFGFAGWSMAREWPGWSGLLLILLGVVWTGIFWVASIHRRLADLSTWMSDSVRADGSLQSVGETSEVPGGLEPRGRAILRRLVSMRERTVGSVVTDREMIVSADCAGGVAEALKQMKRSRYMRIPMTDGSLDRIVGVVHAKDIVPLAFEEGRPRPLKSLMRRPLFVSRDQTISALLELFRAQRGHLAIVVDEYGRTLGLVSRDDVFRHLSGAEGK